MSVQVNDILFKISRFHGLGKVTVTKITPSGNVRVSDGALLTPNLRKKTSDPWDDTMYSVWSQELEDKYNLQKLRAEMEKRLGEIKVSELDKDILETLQEALNKIGL